MLEHSESQEMYLSTIYMLQKKNGTVFRYMKKFKEIDKFETRCFNKGEVKSA